MEDAARTDEQAQDHDEESSCTYHPLIQSAYDVGMVFGSLLGAFDSATSEMVVTDRDELDASVVVAHAFVDGFLDKFHDSTMNREGTQWPVSAAMVSSMHSVHELVKLVSATMDNVVLLDAALSVGAQQPVDRVLLDVGEEGVKLGLMSSASLDEVVLARAAANEPNVRYVNLMDHYPDLGDDEGAEG